MGRLNHDPGEEKVQFSLSILWMAGSPNCAAAAEPTRRKRGMLWTKRGKQLKGDLGLGADRKTQARRIVIRSNPEAEQR